ncbi:hypothetical protein L6164_029332 [Bauhinia variegata]|nr:hypothetical protein L6164_029332 [Bauhinia variegata]
MGRRIYCYLIFLLLGQFLCSGSSKTAKEGGVHVNVLSHKGKQLAFTASISSTRRDITTPITTVPNLIPATPTTSTTPPILNPNSNPDMVSPASTIPVTATPGGGGATPNPPVASGASWCIASPSASQIALQVALDYACGYGATDCSGIQPGGSCYNPNSIRDHASFAFNSYYQKNPVPNSCNFGGVAVITNANPSTGECQYPSTSTSSSVLNATNSSGANVFGAVPAPENPSVSAAAASFSNCLAQICVILWLMRFWPRNSL